MLAKFVKADMICRRASRFFTDSQRQDFAKSVEAALLLNHQLATIALSKKRKLYRIHPKHHALTHIGSDRDRNVASLRFGCPSTRWLLVPPVCKGIGDKSWCAPFSGLLGREGGHSPACWPGCGRPESEERDPPKQGPIPYQTRSYISQLGYDSTSNPRRSQCYQDEDMVGRGERETAHKSHNARFVISDGSTYASIENLLLELGHAIALPV